MDNTPQAVRPYTRANVNKHPMGCEAQLAWKCLFTPKFWRAIFDL